ncbi:hypothetical protein B0H17DRAFT_1331783 [Mycena rosella]|uniref:Uncharacterized protein n=1 Tax=Mycena rosella TaxID=1033263 RepID=A0AAD7DEQ7_MYCRO|nr:hypothetical protein B0H17DRAFT_1331783 [Mycena rosella]
MKARIFCHDSPEFPAPPGTTPLSVIPTASGTPHPHHSWAHCEILPDEHFGGPMGHEKRELGGAVLFGMVLGFLLCAIPFLVLLHRIKRMKKFMKHGGFHGGGRGKFGGHGPRHGHAHGFHRGLPEYEAEQLLKPEYEAPVDC